MDKVATLEELECFWSLDDAQRANAILDMRSDLTEEARRKNPT